MLHEMQQQRHVRTQRHVLSDLSHRSSIENTKMKLGIAELRPQAALAVLRLDKAARWTQICTCLLPRNVFSNQWYITKAKIWKAMKVPDLCMFRALPVQQESCTGRVHVWKQTSRGVNSKPSLSISLPYGLWTNTQWPNHPKPTFF